MLWGCGVVPFCPQMAALQVHAEYGPGLDAEDPEGFSAALERFITRQVLMTRPKDEWRGDVAARCARSRRAVRLFMALSAGVLCWRVCASGVGRAGRLQAGAVCAACAALAT